MYFFYIDESGDRNPNVKRDEPFVLTAVGFYENRWNRFDKSVNHVKRELIRNILDREKIKLELADAEVHSSDIRIPKLRMKHKFLSELTDDELTRLVETFYDQLGQQYMRVFCVVVEKAKLRDYMDSDKLTKKAYELLLERIEMYLLCVHSKHNGICIVDNTTRQLNRSLAMKHSYFQIAGTSSGCKLRHIIEEPLFVESELCNGVQLADLCAYNVFHAFNYKKLDYPFFQRILPYIFTNYNTGDEKIEGLKIFPDDSEYIQLFKDA